MTEEWVEAFVTAYMKYFPNKARAHAKNMALTRMTMRLNNPKGMAKDGNSMMALDIPGGILAAIHAIDPHFQFSRSKVLKRYFKVTA
jgi:hypothetical protein